MDITLDNNDILEIERVLNKEVLKHLNPEENLGFFHYGIICSHKDIDEAMEFNNDLIKHTKLSGCTFYSEPFNQIKGTMNRMEHFNKRCLKILLYLTPFFTKQDICADNQNEILWEFLSKPTYMFKNRIIVLHTEPLETQSYKVIESLQTIDSLLKTNINYKKFLTEFSEDDIEIVLMKNDMESSRKLDNVRKLKQQLYPIIKRKFLRKKEKNISNMIRTEIFQDEDKPLIIVKPRPRAWTSFDTSVINTVETLNASTDVKDMSESNADQNLVIDPLRYPDNDFKSELKPNIGNNHFNEYDITESSEWSNSFEGAILSTEVPELSYSDEIPVENYFNKGGGQLNKNEVPGQIRYIKKSYGTIQPPDAPDHEFSDSYECKVITFNVLRSPSGVEQPDCYSPLTNTKSKYSKKMCCCCEIQ